MAILARLAGGAKPLEASEATSSQITSLSMATIAVGDIHGNLAALSDLLDQIRGESAPDDTVVFLGDYMDRGPDTKGCVDPILGFQRHVRARVVCLLGNHEDWFLRTLHDYGRHSWLLGMAEPVNDIETPMGW